MTQQSAALPYRFGDRGRLEVLLVTSRTRRRWIIPKGKIGAGLLPHRSAEREAFEEAGVLGQISDTPFATYLQGDRLPSDAAGGILVRAFALKVVDELPAWHEMHQRERRWFTLKAALEVVRDRELRRLLRSFDRSLRRFVAPTTIIPYPRYVRNEFRN